MEMLNTPIWCLFNSNDKSGCKILYNLLEKYNGRSTLNTQQFVENETWKFGFISYDFKNEIEDLNSKNSAQIEMPLKEFFHADAMERLSSDELIKKINIEANKYRSSKALKKGVKLQNRTSKEEYFKNFDIIQNHIKRGDIYEINYCMEWFSEDLEINPFEVYLKLNQETQAPYSSLFRNKSTFIISGSPELYLKRKGDILISQPIKGTAKRSKNEETDDLLKRTLKLNTKERAENIMTADVVRNDFSRIASLGSVTVKDLAGLHSFKTVHHLISTIECKIANDIEFDEIIQATFPMPSMTGAPKISAMKIIDEVENFKRGMYSGSIGIVEPNGDFSLNVVIRSIIYDSKKKLISVPVGSAITAKSEPEKEWEECLLKAEAMQKALQ